MPPKVSKKRDKEAALAAASTSTASAAAMRNRSVTQAPKGVASADDPAKQAQVQQERLQELALLKEAKKKNAELLAAVERRIEALRAEEAMLNDLRCAARGPTACVDERLIGPPQPSPRGEVDPFHVRVDGGGAPPVLGSGDDDEAHAKRKKGELQVLYPPPNRDATVVQQQLAVFPSPYDCSGWHENEATAGPLWWTAAMDDALVRALEAIATTELSRAFALTDFAAFVQWSRSLAESHWQQVADAACAARAGSAVTAMCCAQRWNNVLSLRSLHATTAAATIEADGAERRPWHLQPSDARSNDNRATQHSVNGREWSCDEAAVVFAALRRRRSLVCRVAFVEIAALLCQQRHFRSAFEVAGFVMRSLNPVAPLPSRGLSAQQQGVLRDCVLRLLLRTEEETTIAELNAGAVGVVDQASTANARAVVDDALLRRVGRSRCASPGADDNGGSDAVTPLSVLYNGALIERVRSRQPVAAARPAWVGIVLAAAAASNWCVPGLPGLFVDSAPLRVHFDALRRSADRQQRRDARFRALSLEDAVALVFAEKVLGRADHRWIASNLFPGMPRSTLKAYKRRIATVTVAQAVAMHPLPPLQATDAVAAGAPPRNAEVVWSPANDKLLIEVAPALNFVWEAVAQCFSASPVEAMMRWKELTKAREQQEHQQQP